VLLHHLKHNKVLHERVVIMSVATTDIPLVPVSERIESESLGEGFYLVRHITASWKHRTCRWRYCSCR
jgi:KUP system potassium uptake protein